MMVQGRARPGALLAVLALAASMAATVAFAAAGGEGKPSDFLFIVQVLLLIAVGRGLGELMQRIGQPSVMGQLLAGVLLGPSVLGMLWPEAQHAIFPAAKEQMAMIDGIAQFGVLLILLMTGMETDLKLVRKVGKAAVAVSVTGVVVPFACGVLLGQFMPENLLPHPEQRLIASLFLGTALSISSVKIVAVVVREMNFMRRDIGQIIIASAIIDDTIGWIIIAIIFSLASQGTLDPVSLARSILGTLAFLAFSLTIGRRIVFKLIRAANDHVVSEVPVIATILILMCVMALITHLIGVHTVLGAFVAGVLVGESPIQTSRIDDQLRGLIMGLFMPVFFGLAGLSADLTILKDTNILLLTGGLILIASVGKFGGAFTGGLIGGLSRRESYALGSAMNARGSTEVIVASVGLSLGMLSQNLFTMIVAMAIITTLVMPPMLRDALRRLPLGKEEKARLEREEFEAKGFVANLERLLIAVDESNNGKFASRLAGLIAGARGIPTTVLHIGRRAKEQEKRRAEQESPEAVIAATAESSAKGEQRKSDGKPEEVDVTTRAREDRPERAVAEEARKGFDLMLIGVERVVAKDGAFHPDVARPVADFDGPLAVVAARDHHQEWPAESGIRRILLPVSGTPASRRGAEIAIALARANDAPVTAVYFSGGDRGKRRSISATRRYEEEILKEVVALGERYDTRVTTHILAKQAPAAGILRAAQESHCDLIVMGVHRRPGEQLYFGDVAAEVLEDSKASILFVSS
jgi:Kef-type K+ transport system membrane component KefB/nucleotide-binding universal stress UspA family protein